jgi:hypothetical protein
MPTSLSIRYREGLLWADIRRAPLGEVAKALAQETGANIDIYDPAMAAQALSAHVAGVTFEPAIRAILEGYSYAYLAPKNALPSVHVLSTPMTQRRSGVAVVQAPPGPQPLGASQAVPPDFGPVEAIAEEGPRQQTAQQLAKEAQEQEARVARAIEALRSQSEEGRRSALDRLTGIQDPRATEALITAAEASGDAASRTRAVEALWRHAADLLYRDDMAVSALRRLAGDSDRQVSAAAREALQSMEQYQSANATP